MSAAAVLTETYGPPTIRKLAGAARPFLEEPPDGFAAHPLLAPRGEIVIAREDQLDELRRSFEDSRRLMPDLLWLSGEEALRLVPVLKPEAAAAAVHETTTCDIDVAGLHQGFLKGLKARGGRIVCNAEVGALKRRDGLWVAETRSGAFAAPILVNAAGAWADALAAMGGVAPLGMVPKRRSAFTFDPPDGVEIARWPLVVDVAESFYFKPDAGRLLGSPANATPSPPCDAAPEELEIAEGVARIEAATTMSIRRLAHRWAGLRSFVADGVPVAGFDAEAEGFFWLAGQGGYGIKTAPPLARICAALIFEERMPEDVTALGLTRDELSPRRLAAHRNRKPEEIKA